jgi:uncharacterized protein YegP (UPF0339 family)
MAQFQIYKDKKGEFRWRLRAGNQEIIATASEGYKSKDDCEKGISLVKRDAAKAGVDDQTDGA